MSSPVGFVHESPTRAFLRANLDDYLIRDLRSMLAVAPSSWDQGGGIGYPIVMTCFAGIELLGELISTTTYPERGSGHLAFRRYWTQYLYPSSSADNQAHAVYNAARHGIAHLFLLKGNVCVAFKNPQYHLRTDTSGNLNVDAFALATDFIASYETRFLPLLARVDTDPVRVAVEDRTRELAAVLKAHPIPNVFGTPVGPPLPRSGKAGAGFGATGASGLQQIAASASASAAYVPHFPPKLDAS